MTCNDSLYVLFQSGGGDYDGDEDDMDYTDTDNDTEDQEEVRCCYPRGLRWVK